MSNNFPGKQSRVVLATNFKRALAACSWRHGLSQPNDCGKGRLGERKERERSTARLSYCEGKEYWDQGDQMHMMH